MASTLPEWRKRAIEARRELERWSRAFADIPRRERAKLLEGEDERERQAERARKGKG